MESRFTCSICQSFTARNYLAVIRHIGSVHSHEPRFMITCGIEGCIRKYKSYRRFRDHIFNSHSETVPNDTHGNIDEQPQSQDSSNYDADTDVIGNDSTTTAQDDDPPLLHNKAMFILKLKEERRLTQVAIDGLIDDVSTLLEEVLSLKKDINCCLQLQQNVPEHVGCAINEVFSSRMIKSPFEGLQSAHLQKKYFINNFHLVVRFLNTYTV